MYQSRTTISDFCFIAIMAAVTAVMAQISIPMPMGVPMTMQTFAVTLAAIILGQKRSTCDADLFVDRRGRCSGIFKFYRWNSKLCGTNRRISRVISDYGISDRTWRGTKK